MKITTKSPRQYYCLLIGLVLYNNWLLGIIINWPATKLGATISELSVKGQPSAVFFRISDIVAGFLLLCGATYITRLAQSTKQKIALLVPMVALGAGTITDAMVPLNCAATFSRACAETEQLGSMSNFQLFHIAESLLVYCLIFILPFSILIFLRRHKMPRWLKLTSQALIVSMFIWSVITFARYLAHSEAYGYEQRVFSLLFSVWLTSLIIYIKRNQKGEPNSDVSHIR